MPLSKAALNDNLNGLNVSATLAINERSNELLRTGRTVYKLGLGQSPFPVPDKVIEALRFHAAEKNYLAVAGLPALKEAVADFHRLKDKIDASPDGVMIGPGSKELMFLLQLVFKGEIILPTPCWVSYGPQARILGRHLSFLHTKFEHRWRVTPELMNQRLSAKKRSRARLLIFNYPGNPDGSSYTTDELKELAALAREQELLILSDEIYGQLHHKGQHISIARYYPEGTIVSSGLSKWCGAGGWRLGTFTFPNELMWLHKAMSVVASETYTSVSAPIQYAAITAFRGGTSIELYLWHARRILATLGNQCVRLLKKTGIKAYQPIGGFYLFVDFSPFKKKLAARGIHNSKALCEQLLEDTGVAILPGASFERPADELTTRIAYVDFDGAQALAASYNVPLHEKLPKSFVEEHCPKVLRAMEHIVAWLKT